MDSIVYLSEGFYHRSARMGIFAMSDNMIAHQLGSRTYLLRFLSATL
jgi:hypothetical protein